jgi:hypothetical protein
MAVAHEPVWAVISDAQIAISIFQIIQLALINVESDSGV